MTMLEKLKSHKGSLLQLKSELYWYNGRGWDHNHSGRSCLLVDAADRQELLDTHIDVAAVSFSIPANYSAVFDRSVLLASPALLLLIDGKPQWIWVAEADVEVINEAG